MSGAVQVPRWTASVEPHTYARRNFWYVVLDENENGIGEFYGQDHEANVAHVHLAAAAPELLEALENLANAASATSGFASPMFLKDARDAIAKARGAA